MRVPIRGWRSARHLQPALRESPHVPALSPVARGLSDGAQWIPQEPLRLGLGLIALVFYLWIVHSYKLPVGDLAVLALAVGVLIRGTALRVPLPLKIFGGLIIWGCLGFAVTTSTEYTSNALIDLAKVWVIVFLLVNLIRTAAELRFLVIAWLAIFALYPIRGALYNQYICRCGTGGRIAWNFIFENPNDLAALSLIPLGLAAGIAYVERVKIWRLAGAIGVGVVALVIMLTQSRGVMLAIGLAILALPLTSRRRGRDMVLLVIFMGVAALAAPKGVWDRLAGLSNVSVESGMQGVDPEGSAEARWGIWQIAFGVIRQHPVLGVGAGMMPVENAKQALREDASWYVRGARDTHSTYLRLAAELGIPGLLIYLALWGAVFVHIRRVRRRIRSIRPKEHQFLVFVELAMVAYMTASVFGTYGWLSFTYLGLGVAWLTATILEREPWYVPPRLRSPAASVASVRSR
jgi:O-antigen ligase